MRKTNCPSNYCAQGKDSTFSLLRDFWIRPMNREQGFSNACVDPTALQCFYRWLPSVRIWFYLHRNCLSCLLAAVALARQSLRNWYVVIHRYISYKQCTSAPQERPALSVPMTPVPVDRPIAALPKSKLSIIFPAVCCERLVLEGF